MTTEGQQKAAYTFTLLFPSGLIALLQVHGVANQDKARAIACHVLPTNCYEVLDGNQSDGRATFFYRWVGAKLCDGRLGVTASVPGLMRGRQLPATDHEEITRRHTYTCIFPAERIAVVHVIGAQSQCEARAAVRAAWHPCRYEVQDGDLSLGHASPFYLRLDGQRARSKTPFTQEANGTIITTSLFLNEDQPIELHLENEVLSDRARAYSVVSCQVVCWSFRPGWTREVATEIGKALDVQYHEGVFSISGITEENLQMSILRLVNAMLLFYGVMIGASRMMEELGGTLRIPQQRPAGSPLKPYRTIDEGDEE